MKNRWLFAAKIRFLRGPRQSHVRREAVRDVIKQSKLFDPEWYVGSYTDVASAGCDPLTHFIEHGAAEGRNPSERFDLRWYVRRNPDVARSGINPLLHYLEYGRAEGRSICSVGSKGSDDPDDESVAATAIKKGTLKVRAQPYVSDFDPIWQARSIKWSNLPGELSALEGRQDRVGEDAQPSATEWIAGYFASDLPDTVEIARIRWFRAMQRDPQPAVGLPEQPNVPEVILTSQEARCFLIDHGLGLDQIIDGWFAGVDRLMLRISPPAKPSARIYAFQFDASGSIRCCADVSGSGGEVDFVCLTLENELCPVLLTRMDGDGTLTGCAVIPFPSLFRGGLHHSEIMTSEAVSSGASPLEKYATALALELTTQSDPPDEFAIGNFQVDLSGANGTEHLFSPAAVAVLASQFGIRLVALPGGEGTVPLLAERFNGVYAGSRVAARMGTGGLLTLPADGFPSLRIMIARAGSQPLGTNSFCIANVTDRQPEAFVCIPEISPELSKIQHPALPPARPVCVPGGSENWPQFGAPVMIRFRDDKVWKVDTLMPVSPDVSMPLPAISSARRTHGIRNASVVVNQTGERDNLPLLLASLDRQTVGDLEVLLLGDLEADHWAEQSKGTLSAIQVPDSDGGLARRLNRGAEVATADYLVFINASVSLPDPRTLEVLLAIASQPGVASVACSLVCEDSIDGLLSVKSTGIISQVDGIGDSIEWIAERPDVSRLFPTSAYPVVANDMWLCVVPRRVWADLGGFSESASAASLIEMDFAARARTSGLASICTGLVSAAISQDSLAANSSEEAAGDGSPTAMEQSFAEQVTSAWRLGR